MRSYSILEDYHRYVDTENRQPVVVKVQAEVLDRLRLFGPCLALILFFHDAALLH